MITPKLYNPCIFNWTQWEPSKGLAPAATAPARLALKLDRWARDGAVRAEHAAIANLGTENRVAIRAGIEPLTCIGGHGFGNRRVALRAGDHRFKDRD